MAVALRRAVGERGSCAETLTLAPSSGRSSRKYHSAPWRVSNTRGAAASSGSPSSASGNLAAHKAMRWIVKTVGNLHGQTARWRKLGEEPRKQGSVVRYSIAVEHRTDRRRKPRAAPRGVSSVSKLMVGSRFGARLDDFGRAVQAHNRARPGTAFRRSRRLPGPHPMSAAWPPSCWAWDANC